MNALVKKIHMYLGLLNFTALLIFGVAGLMITFSQSPEERKRPQPGAQYREFKVPSNVDDENLGRIVHEVLNVPLTRPVPGWAIRRDRDQNLMYDFYTVNGLTRAVVLEKENRIRIEPTRNGFWQYLNNMHATTARAPDMDLRVRLWGYYIELSIWSLMLMALSGVWLWLVSRPHLNWARWTLAGSVVSCLALFFATR